MSKYIWKIITIISLLVGLIGGYIGYQALEYMKPVYSRGGISLTSPTMRKFDNLKVLFEGKAVPQATVTKIRFWNAGKKTIDYSDVAKSDPIVIHSKQGVRILKCEVLSYSPHAVNAKVDNSNSDTPKIVFDYLDNEASIVIQILHTGTNPDDCFLSGRVKGRFGKLVLSNTRKPSENKYSFIVSLLLWISVALCCFSIYGLRIAFSKMKNLDKGIEEAKAIIEEAKATHNETKTTFVEAKTTLDDAKATYDEAKAIIKESNSALDDALEIKRKLEEIQQENKS